MEEECYFAWKFQCKDSKTREPLVNAKAKRIENIIRCSKLYQDNIHEKLQFQFDNDKDLNLRVHRSCADKYVHPRVVDRALKRQKGDEDEAETAPRKLPRRSEIQKFSFLEHCIFCGDVCQVRKEPKNPSRWKPAYLCRQVDRSGNKMSLKEEIIAKCGERNDHWGAHVRIRVGGAISDLHAADARYHVVCRTNFVSTRSTSAVQEAQADKVEVDKRFAGCY
jgi:hypothetical protein